MSGAHTYRLAILLADAAATVTGVKRPARAECELNQHTAGSVPVPGFGAGDCHAGCGGHPEYLGREDRLG